MEKRGMKLLVALSLMVVLLFGNAVNVFASTTSSENQQLKYIAEGYTESGIPFMK